MIRFRKIVSFILLMLLIQFAPISFGQDLDSLKIGDLINYGKLYEEDILWQVVDMDEDGNPLLLSKNIIDFKPFDASGSQHSPDGYYNWAQYYGSNKWESSTLRQWLNSEEDEVQWKLNPPSKENVYKGINAYDDEPGFLNEENFSLEERNMILQLESGDRVFLLSFDEYKGYYENEEFAPLFTPSEGALERNEYTTRNIDLNLPYEILTREAVEDSPHAVITFEPADVMKTEIANLGRKGIAPAMYLDLNRTAAAGLSEGGETSSINILAIGFLILIGIVLIGFVFKKKKVNLMLLLIVLTLFTACQTQEYEETKVIVLSYASQKELILERLDEFFKDEDSMVMVIDNEGKDRSQWARSHYDKPSSERELNEVFENLYQDGYRVVKGGDFRVSTMKKEIDSVFEDVGLIVTTKNVTEDPHAKFIEDMRPLHEKGDYEGIIIYLEENEYLIKHPYDLFTNGIGPLNLGIDF